MTWPKSLQPVGPYDSYETADMEAFINSMIGLVNRGGALFKPLRDGDPWLEVRASVIRYLPNDNPVVYGGVSEWESFTLDLTDLAGILQHCFEVKDA